MQSGARLQANQICVCGRPISYHFNRRQIFEKAISSVGNICFGKERGGEFESHQKILFFNKQTLNYFFLFRVFQNSGPAL